MTMLVIVVSRRLLSLARRSGPRRYTHAMSDDLVVIRTFLNMVDAELARGALESAGIDSMIRADDCGGLRPHL
jgi:hypothetical protein